MTATSRGRTGGQQKARDVRSEEHTSELQSRLHLVCRLLLEKKKSKRLHSAQSGPRREHQDGHAGRPHHRPTPAGVLVGAVAPASACSSLPRETTSCSALRKHLD